MTLHAACVVEQTLGHVTHAQNLRHAAELQTAVEATWLPVHFSRSLPSRLTGDNWSIQASWKARRALAAVRRARAIDALFFHSQVTSLFSIDLMRRIPSIISLDATPINFDSVGAYYGHAAAADSLLEQAKYRLNRAAFHSARQLVCWSHWAKRSLVTDYGVPEQRIRVIAPGASAPYLAIGDQRAAAELSEPNAQRRVRLLFVGGDFQRKGGPLLLELMRGPLGQRCELHIVTSRPVAVPGNVVVHTGLQPNSQELLRLFEQADVLVLPSMAECLAVVLMEAAAAGLPIVTTDVAALPEAVDPGTSGLLVRPGDLRDLERALHTVVADPGLRTRMGRASHALAMKKFDSRANGLEILELLADIATGNTTLRSAA